jgi:hypothetical protein
VHILLDTPDQLFRSQTVATQLLSKLFTSEPAINFLKLVVAPLIKELESSQNHTSTSPQADDKVSVEFYLNLANNFIIALQNELASVPLCVYFSFL